MCRQAVTCFAMIIISGYVFTINPSGDETAIDNVKDFTALAIIV